MGCSPSPALARPSLLPEPLAAGVRAPASMALHDTRAFFLNELSPLGFIIRRINHAAPRHTGTRAGGRAQSIGQLWGHLGGHLDPPKLPGVGAKKCGTTSAVLLQGAPPGDFKMKSLGKLDDQAPHSPK